MEAGDEEVARDVKVSSFLMFLGNLFHSSAAALWNVRLPYFVLERGTTRKTVTVERSARWLDLVDLNAIVQVRCLSMHGFEYEE
jgi:hypothetical protein